MSPSLWHPFWWPFTSMRIVSATCGGFSDQSPLTTLPHQVFFPSPTKTAPKYLKEEKDGTETEDVSKLENITVFRLNRPWEVGPWEEDPLTGATPWQTYWQGLPLEPSTVLSGSIYLIEGWGKCLLRNGSIGLLRTLYDLHSAWGLDIENEPRQMLESVSYCLFFLMMKPRVSILWLPSLMGTT